MDGIPLIAPEQPVHSTGGSEEELIDQPVLSSWVALVGVQSTFAIAPSMDVLAKTATAQPGMTSIAFRGTALRGTVSDTFFAMMANN